MGVRARFVLDTFRCKICADMRTCNVEAEPTSPDQELLCWCCRRKIGVKLSLLLHHLPTNLVYVDYNLPGPYPMLLAILQARIILIRLARLRTNTLTADVDPSYVHLRALPTKYKNLHVELASKAIAGKSNAVFLFVLLLLLLLLASERSEQDTLRCNAIEISVYLFIYMVRTSCFSAQATN